MGHQPRVVPRRHDALRKAYRTCWPQAYPDEEAHRGAPQGLWCLSVVRLYVVV